MPVEDLTSIGGLSFGPKGDHYFIAVVREHQQSPGMTPGQSGLRQFYQQYQPGRDGKFLPAHDEAWRSTTDCYVPPWGGGRQVDCASRHEHWCGPKTEDDVRDIWERMIEAYERVKRAGYQPWTSVNGFIQATRLIHEDGRVRYLVTQGHHLAAAVSCLGYRRVWVLLHERGGADDPQNVPHTVRLREVSQWPGVRSGTFTWTDAVRFFESYFEPAPPRPDMGPARGVKRVVRRVRHLLVRPVLAWLGAVAGHTGPWLDWELANSYSYLPADPIRTLGCARDRSSREKVRLIRSAIAGRWPGRRLSVLDLGCNNGFFSLQLARDGHVVVGMDIFAYAIRTAEHARRRLGLANASFVCAAATPDTMDRLPSCDVALVLSVFQKWCEQYGYPASVDMLRAVWNRTSGCLFFECADSLESIPNVKRHLPDMGPTKDACQAFVHQMLRDSLGGTVTRLADLPMEYREEHRMLFRVDRAGDEHRHAQAVVPAEAA